MQRLQNTKKIKLVSIAASTEVRKGCYCTFSRNSQSFNFVFMLSVVMIMNFLPVSVNFLKYKFPSKTIIRFRFIAENGLQKIGNIEIILNFVAAPLQQNEGDLILWQCWSNIFLCSKQQKVFWNYVGSSVLVSVRMLHCKCRNISQVTPELQFQIKRQQLADRKLNKIKHKINYMIRLNICHYPLSKNVKTSYVGYQRWSEEYTKEKNNFQDTNIWRFPTWMLSFISLSKMWTK